MNNWFLVKVRYTKQLENGSFKRVTEPYLLSAMTFTDAEARIYEELGQIIRGEFNIVAIQRYEVADIFQSEDADVWYKAKVVYSAVDADEERGKKVVQNFLLTAHSVKDAAERLREELSTLMVDYKVPAVVETPIVDIFPYSEQLDRELSRTPIKEETPAN
jgi:hypothetical protein